VNFALKTASLNNRSLVGLNTQDLRFSRLWRFESMSSELWRCAVLRYEITSPWRWRQRGPQKHWYPTATLHGVI